MRAYRPKHEVLKDFIKILFKHNPMQLNLAMNPDAETEYESEALSILSRFNEGVVHMCDDLQLQAQVCDVMVRHALEFWFNPETPECDTMPLTTDLLNVYVLSYPEREQKADKEVVSKA